MSAPVVCGHSTSYGLGRGRRIGIRLANHGIPGNWMSPVGFSEPHPSSATSKNVVSFGAGAYGDNIMSISEVKRLPLAEKLQIMEAIWDDLRAQAERVPVPQWHRDLLDERRKAVEEGREELLNWDKIKDSLPSRRNT